MSSIRLFLLSGLADRGPMHGHQMRLLAEEEHVHHWTDISVGSLYGAMKRLATEGLIEEVRVEREGNYPERQVYAITPAGRESLAALREEALTEIVIRPDPFDLGLTRLDPDRLSELGGVVERRLELLGSKLAASRAQLERARPFLTVTEAFTLTHKFTRIEAEIAWHSELLHSLPQIIADESARKDRA